MKRLFIILALTLLLAVSFPSVPVARGQTVPKVSVNSQYIIHSYGYAVINESVTFTDNASVAEQIPQLTIGFTQNVTSRLVVSSDSVTGTGYSLSTGGQGNQTDFVVSNGQSLSPGDASSFSFKVLVNDIAVRVANVNQSLLLMTSPSISLQASTTKLEIRAPLSMQFISDPTGYQQSLNELNGTYFDTITKPSSLAAASQVLAISPGDVPDFTPIVVYHAIRTISVGSNGLPTVEDSLLIGNLGTSELTNLVIAPLEPDNGTVTVLPPAQPPLITATSVPIQNDEIDFAVASYALPVAPGANLTLVYSYPLSKQYYTESGGTVKVTVPSAPPIEAFVDTYVLKMTLTPGFKVVQTAPSDYSNVLPLQPGSVVFSYDLSVGWALDPGVPAASAVFVILLVGAFAVRSRSLGEEELEAEEVSSEEATAMVKAFEEKTTLINTSFEEVAGQDPNQVGKTYFDGIRGRFDTFRSRALQRLNELKQKSASSKFTDVLSQLHDTEREVDRAAKDLLNLYEQYYTKRMRKEVFDKLLPSYRRRLDRAQNKLSDELNTAQREAKLL
ncbi:MAG TPA: hypothetical protein VEJ36_08515 [Nitrososphaerales archaeon]|nr:hypothetical protein [Nitrososphaerales archaeon]